jgi:hypothetical protein
VWNTRASLSRAREDTGADTARLDWLEVTVPTGEFRKAVERVFASQPFTTVRGAIDAARARPETPEGG